MSLFYRSTRDDSVRVTASQAILKGLAPDGGLLYSSLCFFSLVPMQKEKKNGWREIC